MYENGTGVSQDHTQALSLFRKACDGGAAIGCNNLGVMYEKEKDATAPPK
jgi:TPR repeat protein